MLWSNIYTRILKISIKNFKGYKNVWKSIETSSDISVLWPIAFLWRSEVLYKSHKVHSGPLYKGCRTSDPQRLYWQSLTKFINLVTICSRDYNNRYYLLLYMTKVAIAFCARGRVILKVQLHIDHYYKRLPQVVGINDYRWHIQDWLNSKGVKTEIRTQWIKSTSWDMY